MAWGWVRWIRICIPRYHSVLTPTKRVITVAPMPPEKSAYALARYSRSPDSIRESMQWVRTHNSEKFLESFYFQYGHASIADLGHTVMCFEGISELAATEIEAEPLWDGQAKSSRYQDFSRSGFITPPELTDETAAAYQAAGEALLAAYAKVKDLAFAALCERLPRPADMKPDAYERNLTARAFDVARYLLFWGVPTNVGQVASIRTVEKQIRRLKASEYEELRSLGDEIAQACAALPDCVWDANAKPEALAPTLARHADADQHAVQSREDLRLWAVQNLPARAGRFCAAQSLRSSRDCTACWSASAWRARVGASASGLALASQTQSGRAAHACAISSPRLRSSSYSEAFSRRICFSTVRMLATCPTLVGTPQKSR